TPTFARPERVRGIYLNAWTAGSERRLEALLDLARKTEVNSFVIDIKDASGYVSHSTAVTMARDIGATGEIRIRDLNGLLARLAEEDVYPIARIVIVKDPILVAARPDLAVRDTAGGVWVDSNDIRWLNPHDRVVWSYHLDLAREVALLGFPEIQFDYVRFPDAPSTDLDRAHYPGAGDRSAPETIRAFFEYAREYLSDLDVVLTADVFGVTTSSRDVGIGQVWERFIDVVDVALPMVYPSHYWSGSFGIEDPNAHPYEIVYRALDDARRRSEAMPGAGTTRPWLQAFSLGEPPYGAPEVRAQIQAGYDVGMEEWFLWSPASRYQEDFFEPVDGFREEPLIRVAGRLVPVSQRFRALEEASAAERDSTRVVPPVEVKPDTMRADTGRAGSVYR
ncbi:MAG TPA: putative glycoside hydrolase, partial [Longimicrobiales bacterium]